MDKTASVSIPRHNRVICVPFSPSVQDYNKTVHDSAKFRASVNARIEQFPELFPAEITAGYRMKDIKESKKLSNPIRRIEVSGISYTIRPSFVMPYMTGFVKDVEKGLFLRKHDVPFYIKIRDRSKKKFKDIYEQVVSKLWNCYHAENKASFSQRVRRLYEWGKKTSIPSFMMGKIEKLRNNIASFSIAYDFPGSHRTSNMLDRLMQRMDRHLFSTNIFMVPFLLRN